MAKNSSGAKNTEMLCKAVLYTITVHVMNQSLPSIQSLLCHDITAGKGFSPSTVISPVYFSEMVYMARIYLLVVSERRV